MSNFIINICIIVCIIGCSEKNATTFNKYPTHKNDLQKANINGSVKSVTLYQPHSIGDTSTQSYQITIFNTSGFIAQQINYDTLGRINTKNLFTYESDNDLKNMTVYENDTLRFEYECIKTRFYKFCVTKDFNNNIINLQYFNLKNEKSQEYQFLKGKLSGKIIYMYDENGALISQRLWHDGELAFESTFINNERSFPKEVSTTTYISDRINTRSKMLFDYDNYQNILLIKEIRNSKMSNQKSFFYEYDSMNNWIVQNIVSGVNGIENDSINYIINKNIVEVNRKFEYYK
ncbi:MAG: hypothetical protein ACOZCO_12975 [Bacteroidota bacterium]